MGDPQNPPVEREAPEPSYQNILDQLGRFDTMRFSSDPEAQEALVTMLHDAVVAMLEKLATRETQ